MGQLRIGVMLGLLERNVETVNAITSSLNKIIIKVELKKEENILSFIFEDNTILNIIDGGQSCCEYRYMDTDDNLSEYSGAKLLDFELKDAPNQEIEYGDCHEIQFLDVKTDKGIFQISNHNEHNGYYGGFLITATN